MNYSRSEIVSGQAAEKLGSQPPQIALPRVSVIVTCFNYARYVSQALDSVLSQTYGNFDCVIVDDASTDDSALLIERWIEDNKDPRFRFIRNPSNRGQTGSFAAGLAATSGEFVAFLDADDFWFPQFLQRHVEAHLNRSFFASLSCSDLVQIDGERRMICGTMAGPVFEQRDASLYPAVDADHSARVVPGITSPELRESPTVKYIRPGYLYHPWTATSGMVFRRSTLDLVMPNESGELRICTDWYIFVICHYLTGTLAIGSALGAYRRHGNNNFASNPMLGSDLPSTPSAISRHHKTVVSVMLRHLLDNYERFATAFAGADIRKLVSILFDEALRENVSIKDSRLRSVLGTREMLEAKLKVRLPFLKRLARWLPFRRAG